MADEASAEFRANAADARHNEAATRKLLDQLSQDPPWAAAESREFFRLDVEMLPQSSPGRAIVEAHDPTVAFDRARKYLVTERSLSELRQAYAWVSKLLGTPGPGSDYIPSERAFLRAQFASLPDARQEAFEHVERNYTVTANLIERADKAKVDAWVRESRPIALKLDPQQRSLRLADVLSETFTAALNEQLMRNAVMQNTQLDSGAEYNSLYGALYRNRWDKRVYQKAPP